MIDEEEEYLTLFCEGDGSVSITPDGYPKVSFGQMERDVLNYIASLTEGGRISQRKDSLWQLEYNGSNCIELLETFSRHVVGRSFLERLNTVLEHIDMPLAVQHPLTLEGFVAFWDAEGSSNNQPTIFVSQKDREILDLIVEMCGGGVTRYKNWNSGWMHKWHLSGEGARELYKIVLEKSHCPTRAEELRRHFEEDQGKYQKQYYEQNAEERRAYAKRHRTKQKLLLEYMKAHPEVMQLEREVGSYGYQ